MPIKITKALSNKRANNYNEQIELKPQKRNAQNNLQMVK